MVTTPTPTATTMTFYDLMEMCEIIDKKLGYDQRNVGKHLFPDAGDFYQWCDHKGYGETDPEGKHRGSSQIWFAEQQKEIADGKWEDIPYMDFWHWQLEHYVEDNFRNDSYSKIYVGLGEFYLEDAEDWQRDIQKVWHEEFKHLANEHGWVDVWVSW